jgi:hypothetical protein
VELATLRAGLRDQLGHEALELVEGQHRRHRLCSSSSAIARAWTLQPTGEPRHLAPRCGRSRSVGLVAVLDGLL